ncbi:MAG: PD-(D/E)XK nuclease family protein [Candidatus Omnitrophica bacterium]|nr:PD-(D/E)XK nuclease family protein [Candidatus Omnitrophota bacterium]MDD5351721.1 PD-(D/E)XK nuclease family protein [Candidatus Omnitrophota bacterium]MDD5550931.1 PD-(D/E)XK nuclease family protein [Candidatus Omnitrophota bacterium]
MFDPKSAIPFKLSRTKIDLFLSCPRCFYLDRRLGVGQPPGFPFSLNSAVDTLLKKEFDVYRKNQIAHPLMKVFGIDAIPFQHENLEEWRDALRKGISYFHKPTNFTVTGAIDDVWMTPEGELLIVDYKSTSKKEEVNLDAEWQITYKKQMELYQWLFRRNEFRVSETGYFVYCNGLSDKETFANKLEFDIKIIPYKGNDAWVESTLIDARKCLDADTIPRASPDCDFCRYCKLVKEVELDKVVKQC